MLNAPVRFDANEWFVCITMLVLIVLFAVTPKMFSMQAALCLMLFHSVLGLTADMIIGVAYPWDFYDTMDTPGYDWFDFFIYTVNYPLYGYFFGTGMKLWERRGWPLPLLIAGAALLSLLLEWLSVQFQVFQYKNGWHVWDSLLAYSVIFCGSAAFVKLVMRWEGHVFYRGRG